MRSKGHPIAVLANIENMFMKMAMQRKSVGYSLVLIRTLDFIKIHRADVETKQNEHIAQCTSWIIVAGKKSSSAMHSKSFVHGCIQRGETEPTAPYAVSTLSKHWPLVDYV